MLPHALLFSTDQRDTNSLATPFALMDKLFGPYSWSQTSKARVSEKLEVYFQEFDLLPLFVQENYLKHKYARANEDPRHPAWKKMQLTSQAADAISDGDMVDRMIHG
jgi:replication factor C subunit 1